MTLRQIHTVVKEFLFSGFDTENIACDLWVEAWKRQRESFHAANIITISELDPPISRQVIHNRCVDEVRKRGTERRNEVGVEKARQQEPFDSEFEKRLSDLMARLPADQRRVIFSRYYLGKSLSSIAEELKVTIRDVTKILATTLEILRAMARETEVST